MTATEFVTLAKLAAENAERSGFHNTARALRRVVQDMSGAELGCKIQPSPEREENSVHFLN